MNEASNERRAYPRFNVDAHVPGSLLFRTQGRASNMSLTGLSVETPERLEIGRTHYFRIAHPRGGRLQIRGTVVWCHLMETWADAGYRRPTFRAGVELEGILSSEARKMQLFLESEADMTFDQRVFGRFDLSGARDIDIATRFHFTIKTVSKSGLSIETEHLPPINSRVRLRLSLPERIATVDARVAQLKPTGRRVDNHLLHQIGLEFTRLHEIDFDPLDDLIPGADVSISRDYDTNKFLLRNPEPSADDF